MTCSTLALAQDDAAGTEEAVDALERERQRRVWWMAERRERLTILEKLDPAVSLFDRPPPDPAPRQCNYPGCTHRRMLHGILCTAHHRQAGRNGGRLYLRPLTRPTWVRPPTTVFCGRCGANEWSKGRSGRQCRSCARARAAASYARRQA